MKGQAWVPFHRAGLVTKVLGLWKMPDLRAGMERLGRGVGLWVLVASGDPPKALPSLQEIADLREGGLAQWQEILTRYGPPVTPPEVFFTLNRRERPLTVAEATVLAGTAQGGFPQIPPPSAVLEEVGSTDGRLYGLPLWWLRGIAIPAGLLLACEKVLLHRRLDSLRRELHTLHRRAQVRWVMHYLSDLAKLTPADWPAALAAFHDEQWPPPEADDRELVEFAQRFVGWCAKGALAQCEPATTPSGRGVSGESMFLAHGWWPLVVLDHYVPRERIAPVKCAARDCDQVIPPGKVKIGLKYQYCSDRCRWREKQRRHREREMKKARHRRA